MRRASLQRSLADSRNSSHDIAEVRRCGGKRGYCGTVFLWRRYKLFFQVQRIDLIDIDVYSIKFGGGRFEDDDPQVFGGFGVFCENSLKEGGCTFCSLFADSL